MHGETKKFVWFALLPYLLSCYDLEWNLQYLWYIAVYECDIAYKRAQNEKWIWLMTRPSGAPTDTGPVEEEVLETAPQYQGPERPSLCFSWTSPHVCKICHSGGYYILTQLHLKTGFKNISHQILSKIGSVRVIRERSPGVPLSFCQRGKMSLRNSSADSFLGLAGQHWVTWPSLAATESGKLSCLAVGVLGAEQGRKGCW